MPPQGTSALACLGAHNRPQGFCLRYTLELDRNRDFTASVQIAYARAAARLAEQGATGAYTVLELAPYLLSPKLLDELIRRDL